MHTHKMLLAGYVCLECVLGCRRYIQLYKHKLDLLRQGSSSLLPLSPDELRELQLLELHMGVPGIMLSRQLAELAAERESNATGVYVWMPYGDTQVILASVCGCVSICCIVCPPMH